MLHLYVSFGLVILITFITPGRSEDIIMDELDKNTVDSGSQPDNPALIHPQFMDETAKEIYRKLLKTQQGGQIVTRKEYLKKDWCKAEPIVHKIREAGCIPNTVINRFCYGQCNSFYIPGRSGRRRRSEVDFRSCAACRPSLANWITVSLSCPDSDPPHKSRRVYRVKKCKCVAHDFL
ncbi:hypothetical protein O3M35_007629 [Rhynocoris fuscipes]|uniref:CTCK domain-containing protein n=1 Tax=Rhynocoris fuscipes TaxID=488301 RepID=A0AAW1DAR8_9HEMI